MHSAAVVCVFTNNALFGVEKTAKEAIAVQKLTHIHYNPVKAGLVASPSEYKRSYVAF
jgi:hypothetical protein